MAENKKSFVLYADLITNIDHLTNEEKGVLFNHLLEYVNDMNPILTDRVVLSAWKFIQSQLKRDLVKFEEVKGKRSEAGKKSAELRALNKKQQNPTKPTSVESVQQSSTNPTVSVNVNDNVNDNIYIETTNNLTQEHFLKRWSDARLKFDKMPTNIKRLTTFEILDFKDLLRDYNAREFDQAIQGLFQQKTFPKTRLRPTHFLKREHFETYLTCFETKEKLFENKYK